jgi:acyl carrier protein
MQNDLSHRPAEAQQFREVKTALMTIWSDVLSIDCSTTHEGFLSLGGDSLAAMRCINRINSAFGIELPLDLFLIDSADIAQFASLIRSMQLNEAPDGTAENA